MRECSKCKVLLLTEDFHKHYKKNGGLRPDCKYCVFEYNEKRRPLNRLNEKKWRTNNRYKYLNTKKKYAKNNRGKLNAYAAQRKAGKVRATPEWLSEEQKEEIKQVYIRATFKCWREDMEVDHIVPIRGKNVSGLHVPWNLQLITKTKNRSKGNKYE